MTDKQIKRATQTYNNIMYDICREYLTIGDRLSERTENWNIRDLVCEIDYTLNIYLDESCMPYQDAHYYPEDKYNRQSAYYTEWYNPIQRMKRFIKTYEPLSRDIIPTESHCSQYDF
ncbi:MAG: hypothetical protein J1E41_01645 [Ruminococcus sp.]|nr:hypothetical protein [Ruminococcus sp.]